MGGKDRKERSGAEIEWKKVEGGFFGGGQRMAGK